MEKRILFLALLLLSIAQIGRSQDGFPLADKVYTIHRNGNASAYMYDNGTGISTSTYDATKPCFWRFIPTANEKCFYIQNVVTGRYVQTTNIALSSLVSMGDAKVEFRVDADATTGAGTKGFYYMCSTDQTISNATDGTLGLNFGATGVVAYYIKTGRGNSYWEILETTDSYDIHPFESVATMSDTPSFIYTINTLDKKDIAATDGTLSLVERSSNKNEEWYFVGSSNLKEGYVIVSNLYQGQTINVVDGVVKLSKTDTPTRWYVRQKEEGARTCYTLVPYADKDNASATSLTIDGISEFMFTLCRSDYARTIGVYNYPCGAQGSVYLTSATIKGENVLSGLTYQASAKPNSYYTIYTADKATVEQGKSFDVSLNLNNVPSGLSAYLYFDWNADGVFDKTYTLQPSTMMNQQVDVPQSAATAKTRMRVRLTTNGLDEAEDEVEGNTYDFIVNVAGATDVRNVSASVNDDERGVVEMTDGTGNTVAGNATTCAYGDKFQVKATHKGNSTFVCWKDGNIICSTDSAYSFDVKEDRALVACFSPNTTGTATLISNATVHNFLYNLTAENKSIYVESDGPVKYILLFDANGALVKKTTGNKLKVGSLSTGIYIVKVCTALGSGSQKVVLH